MNLTKQQKQIGKDNFHGAVAEARKDDPVFQEVSRRSLLKGAAAVIPGVGAAYFGYQALTDKDKVKVGIIGTGKEGGVLISEHPVKYMDIVAIADLRKINRERAFRGDGSARVGLIKKLGDRAKSIERNATYHTYQEMLDAHPEIEAVVIAVPLSHHFQIAKDCIERGKHVLTEKLMCWSVRQCKRLIKIAKDNNKLLAVGHQRHYSALYDNSNFLVRQGILGDVKFIRAQWHRNMSFDGRDSWRPKVDDDLKDTGLVALIKKEGYEKLFKDGGYETRFQKAVEDWNKAVPKKPRKYDRNRALIEFLCRWRLYNSTGGGLMAELGSHQLDACSIFLGKVRPIAVQGYGGKNYFHVSGVGTAMQQADEREVDDNVYVTIEFPGKHYAADKDDKVIVTYSSINTNKLEPYGETIFGSRGTMMVHNEQETMLYKEAGPRQPGGVEQRLAVIRGKGGPVLNTSESLAPSTAVAQAAIGKVSRGYAEEMEHFCYAVRNAGDYLNKSPEEGGLKCNGEVAMADAIMALTSNLAMKAQRRIVFKDEWFDYKNPATPETDPEIQKWIKDAQG
ncbi:MAG: Gfo/Idh/MocA family protein [Planctomycetaceae bacterium]